MTATVTCTPTPSTTPTTWETTHGKSIASAALELLANQNNYYIWGADGPSHENEKYTDPPPREVPPDGFDWYGINVKERIGEGRIPIVCADVNALSYENGGLPLTGFITWYNSCDNDPTRNVVTLYNLLWDKYNKKVPQCGVGTGALPELGDMVLSTNLVHSGVVVEIKGPRNDANNIMLVQASYSQGIINKMSLALWQSSLGKNSYIGHP